MEVLVLKLGVLVIGSLLWDDEQDRRKWRENDLDSSGRFQVYLPIRYGRLSNTRRIHTMVFSKICYSKNYGIGKGWLLPVKNEIENFDDLIREIKKMGSVEGFFDEISSSWGSVAIKFNPQKKNLRNLKKKWTNYMSKKLDAHELLKAKLKSEGCSISHDGLLKIKWPQPVNENQSLVNIFDFLVATLTTPTLKNGRFPSAHVIANSINNTGFRDYFLNNIENGITTFQDHRILKAIT